MSNSRAEYTIYRTHFTNFSHLFDEPKRCCRVKSEFRYRLAISVLKPSCAFRSSPLRWLPSSAVCSDTEPEGHIDDSYKWPDSRSNLLIELGYKGGARC